MLFRRPCDLLASPTHILLPLHLFLPLTPSKNVQTIHFAPYTPTQLQDILQSCSSPLHSTELAAEVKKFLPPPTLMLLTKKVAALTGDIRSLFVLLTILLGSKRLKVGLSLSTSSNTSPKRPTAAALKRTASSPNPAVGAAVRIETGFPLRP